MIRFFLPVNNRPAIYGLDYAVFRCQPLEVGLVITPINFYRICTISGVIRKLYLEALTDGILSDIYTNGK